MNIQYRKLLPTESKLYREIRLESLQKFPGSFGSSFEEESAKPKLAFEINIEQQTANKFIIGAFDGDKLVGICGFSQEGGAKSKHKGVIVQVYIRPQYQGKKLGVPLIQTAIDEAFKLPEIEQLLLGAATNNPAAIKTYQRAGFAEYGLHPGYLKLGDTYIDEKLMILVKPR